MAGVRDLMARVDARIYKSKIVRALMLIGTESIEGAFFKDYRDYPLPDGGVAGLAISFECRYSASIGQLERNDLVSIDDYGEFRFLRELIPRGDESGKTIIELGSVL